MTIIPIFRSHYSIGNPGLFTLEEPGKSKPGAPQSIFDLAQEAGLQEVVVIDNRIDGFLQAYKSCQKAFTLRPPRSLEDWIKIHSNDMVDDAVLSDAERQEVRLDRARQAHRDDTKRYEEQKRNPPLAAKLCYGLKLRIVPDMADRTPESRRSESSVVILVTGGKPGYQDLIRIWNRAWGKDGHFVHRDERYGRGDWALLKHLWTENLGLALPWHSSFIARNTLSFASITPDLPVARPWVLREVDSGLPFARLIDAAIDRYVGTEGADQVVRTKTVAYRDAAAFRPYTVMRAIAQKGAFDAPGIDHLSSDRFSFEAWRALESAASAAGTVASTPVPALTPTL